MNWDDVRVFLAVARQGQLLGAARSLGLNHATVARRLNALEQALGSTFFIRRTNGTELSGEGERFLIHAERMESAMLAAQEAAGADSQIAGTVRVGAPDGFGVAFLAPRLGRLTRRHPGLRVELVPVPRAFSLSRRVARKLTDYQLGLYAARDYLNERGMPASLEQLGEHQLVGYVEDLIFSPWLDYTGEFSRQWRSSLAISSAMGQAEAVRAGAGIGILHTYMAKGDDRLVPILPEHKLTRSYWTVVHEDLRAIRRVALVSEFLSEIVAEARGFF